jgi:murein DD-endopeptidase MepM/ murein hydrolase activator NlpD
MVSWRRVGQGFAPIVLVYATTFIPFLIKKPTFYQRLFVDLRKRHVVEPVPSVPRVLPVQKKVGIIRPPSITLTLGPRETLHSLLHTTKLSYAVQRAILNEVRRFTSLRSLPVGQKFFLRYHADGTFYRFSFAPRFGARVVVKQLKDESFVGQEIKHPVSLQERFVSGTIRTNLYREITDQNISPSIRQQVITLLGKRFDLQRDLKSGDTFKIVFREKHDDVSGKTKGLYPLLIMLKLHGRTHFIYRFKAQGKAASYFDQNGRGLQAGLLRTPVNGARLSSGFGYRRHPILGYSKLHKGIDFAAPKGTPIMAAGSGTVDKAGYNGSYGHYVRIVHENGYATAYAHLNRYRSGIAKGKRVLQGDIIGYIGASGRATGPHLHFELHKNGKPIDPKRIKNMPQARLQGAAMKHFHAYCQRLNTRYHISPTPS